MKGNMNHYRSSSAWTGRAPRTCQEAFGPYTNYAVVDSAPKGRVWPWLVWALVCFALLCLLAWAPR